MTGYHARVVRKDNKIFLEDMKSMNGYNQNLNISINIFK